MGLNSHSQYFEVLLLCSTSWCYWAKPTTTIEKESYTCFIRSWKSIEEKNWYESQFKRNSRLSLLPGIGVPTTHSNLPKSFLWYYWWQISSNTLSEIPRQQSLYFKLECLWVKFYTIADNGLRKMTVTVDGRGMGSWRCDTLENTQKRDALNFGNPETSN